MLHVPLALKKCFFQWEVSCHSRPGNSMQSFSNEHLSVIYKNTFEQYLFTYHISLSATSPPLTANSLPFQIMMEVIKFNRTSLYFEVTLILSNRGK